MKKVVPVWLVLLLVLPFPLLLGGADAPAHEKPTTLDEFEVVGDGDALLLPVTLDGKTHLFVLDTGTTYTIFDKSLKSDLGDPIDRATAATGNGVVRMMLYRMPKASVGTTPLETDSPVSVLDLTSVREGTGLQVEGVLGMDFLRRHVLRIDFDAARVSFLRSADTDAGESLDLTYNDADCPCVEGKLPDGAAERFNIDTGWLADSGSIRSKAFQSLQEGGGLHVGGKKWGRSASGKSRERWGRLETLQVGKGSHKGLIMTESSGSTLGLNYLSRYTVTFDFPNQKLYLRPGKGFDRPDEEDASGLRLRRHHGHTVVDTVEKGSPAESAGLKEGDVILTVCDKDADKLRLFEICSLLCEKDKTVQVRFKRGHKQKEASLVLAPWQTVK